MPWITLNHTFKLASNMKATLVSQPNALIDHVTLYCLICRENNSHRHVELHEVFPKFILRYMM